MSSDASILGYQLTDLLTQNDNLGFTDLVYCALCDIIYFLKLRSRLLNQFFDRLTLPYTRSRFRLVLTYIYLLLCITIIVFYARMPVGGTNTLGVVIFLSIGVVNFFHLITIRRMSHKAYGIISIIVLSSVSLVILMAFGTITVYMSLEHTMILLLTSISHTNLPIPFAFTFSVQFLLVISLSAVNTFKTESKREMYMGTPTAVWIHILSITALMVYVKLSNVLRFRACFLRMCQAVEARRTQKAALAQQLRWFDVVMPKTIRANYWLMLRKNKEKEKSSWVFCDSYESVSILFCNMTDFSEQVEGRSPIRALAILNDMFKTFDSLCYNCNCEKINTLGDVYYCVSGCPMPRADHAICCAELALAMLRAIGPINQEHTSTLDLNIGIHSGHVNGAIIGTDRFRFDIFSYDVSTAQQLQQTCPPGKIHISRVVRDLLPPHYTTTPGVPIAVKVEVQSAIAGMKLDISEMDTFYIDQNSEYMLDDKTLASRRRKKEAFLLAYQDEQETDSPNIGNDIADPVASSQWDFHRKKGTTRYNVLGDYSDIDAMPKPRNHWLYTNQWNPVNDECRRGDMQNAVFGQPVAQQNVSQRFKHFKEIHMKDIEIIEALRSDPMRPTEMFGTHPLQAISLRFLDPNMEKNYLLQNMSRANPVYVDSLKISPGIDAICLFIYLLLFSCTFILYISTEQSAPISLLATTLTVLICFSLPCLAWIVFASFIHSRQLKNNAFSHLLLLSRRPQAIECICGLNSQFPTLMMVLYFLQGDKQGQVDGNNQFIVTFGLFAIFAHCLPMNSRYYYRTLASAISTGVIECLLFYHSSNSTHALNRYENAWYYKQSIFQPYTLGPAMALWAAWVLVVIISRINESSCRLAYFMIQEAIRSTEKATEAATESSVLLHNFIPQYVLKTLQAAGRNELLSDTVNHAVLVPATGIVFIRITNFFEGYYREDYQGGKLAIGLLNKIICGFDRLVRNYKDVEKMKSFNDSYMAVAGINMDSRIVNQKPLDHVIQLLDFCHALQRLMDQFNDEFIIGLDKFTLAMGVDVGTVIAGLVGTVKPTYDVWGKAAGQAFRLHQTATENMILVKKNLRDMMMHEFEFTPADINVGGATLYICNGRIFS